jgi:glycosyltransferase involved in cell wall biosynthesis
MRICFIEDTPLHGGTQIWVTEATQAFMARGEVVTVLAPEESWVSEKCAEVGARIVSYDWDEVVNQSNEHIQIWSEALSGCEVAVCTVHPPRNGFHCSVFAAKCIKESNLKTYLVPKTGTIVPEYHRKFYLPDETINTSILTITRFTRQYLIDAYKIPASKITLIYQGTDVERFQSTEAGKREAMRRYPLPANASPILASVGSFEQRKGHPVLFEAISQLVAGSLPNIHLMMVGDGPDEQALRDKVNELAIGRNVSFFPFTNEPQYVFERADVTVLPSLYKEGLPNVLLESMSMGVPVVSSNLGGVPEIVINGRTGFMVEPVNSDQLAQAIQKLWNDRTGYMKMRQNARQLMTENFDKEHQFDQFLKYFRSLLIQ